MPSQRVAVLPTGPPRWVRTHRLAAGSARADMSKGAGACHAAMVDVSVSGVVRARARGRFCFLADLENWPRWQSDMKATSLADGQRGELGAVYCYVSRAMGTTFKSTVRH